MRNIVCLIVLLQSTFSSQQAFDSRITSLDEFVDDVVDGVEATKSLVVNPDVDVTWQLAYLTSRCDFGLEIVKDLGRMMNTSTTIGTPEIKDSQMKLLASILRKLTDKATGIIQTKRPEESSAFYQADWDFRKITSSVKSMFDLELVNFFAYYKPLKVKEDAANFQSQYKLHSTTKWLTQLLANLNVDSETSWMRQHGAWAACNFERLSTFYSETTSYILKALIVDEFYSGLTRELWSKERGLVKYWTDIRKIMQNITAELKRCQRQSLVSVVQEQSTRECDASIAASQLAKSANASRNNVTYPAAILLSLLIVLFI